MFWLFYSYKALATNAYVHKNTYTTEIYITFHIAYKPDITNGFEATTKYYSNEINCDYHKSCMDSKAWVCPSNKATLALKSASQIEG